MITAPLKIICYPPKRGGTLGIGQEIDPSQFIKTRAAILHEQLNVVMRQAARGELDGVEIEDGALYIARMKAAVPEAARDLAIQLNGMLPRVRITELLSRLRRSLRASTHRQPGGGQAGAARRGARGRH